MYKDNAKLPLFVIIFAIKVIQYENHTNNGRQN